jgi:plastocyanin
MKKLLLLTVAILLSNFSFATNHTVSTIGMTFNPNALTINIGDSVTFINTGGFHNVNGTTATFPNNPAGFSNPTGVSSGWTYLHVFTTPGTYNYQCDPHIPGMVGTIIVQPSSSPTITSIIPTNPLCYLDINGSATVSINQSNPPIDLNVQLLRQNSIGFWIQIASSNSNVPAFLLSHNFVALGAGAYRVDLKDAVTGVLFDDAFFNLLEPAELIVNIDLDNAILCNGGTGDLSITTTGGTSPISSYSWSNGTNGLTTTGLSGNYVSSVIDANGCLDTAHYYLSEPLILTISASNITVFDAKCKGDSLGETYIQATGGTPIPGIPGKYDYELFDVDSILINQQLALEAQFTGLSTGNYYVVVTDNNGCTDTTGIIFISEPNNDSYDETAMLNDGYAVVYPTGGTPTYTFIWDNGSTNQSNGINNSYQQILTAGANTFHTIIVNDANGCEVSDSIIINAYSPTGLLNIKNINKELLKVTDLLGRETKQTNQPLFYIYDDGTVEKRIVIE